MDLSLRERDRISVLRQVSEGVLTVAAGAERIGVTRRHFRRLRRKFEAEGDAAAVHGLRGRRSNRALRAEDRERALEVAKDPLYRDLGPTLLAEHLARRFGLRLSAETLRFWMLEAGLWERRRKGAKHRRRRPRRAALGEPGSGTARCASRGSAGSTARRSFRNGKEPQPRGARLPKLQNRRPQGPPHTPPSRGPGPGPRLPPHARTPRRVAHETRPRPHPL